MIWVAKNLYFFNCLLDGAHTREKIYIKGIGQRHMPDFLGGHPDNLTEFISYRITGVP